MKTLIMSTGRDKEIKEIWLPSLRQRAKYSEDILLLDYDMETVLEDKSISVIKVERVYPEIASDRMRAFYEYLKYSWQNYDVIMIVDSDMEFFKSLNPLFEMARNKLCYVKEVTLWKHIYRVLDQPFPNISSIWETIKNEKVINAGVIVGPSQIIFELVKFISENFHFDASFGADQLLLNAVVYYYKSFPSKEVDSEWNFDERNGVSSEIAILHKIGIRIHNT